MDLLKTQMGRLRVLAFMEGVSFLAILFVTMPLKYVWQMSEPNKVVGLAHGLLFVLYILAVVQIAAERQWDKRKTFLSLLASVVPFGTFWADAKIFKLEA